MNTKQALNRLLQVLIYLVIRIGSIVLTAGLVAYITSQITEDVNVIINACLISIWVVMTVLVFVRSRMVFRRQLNLADNTDGFDHAKEKKRLQIRSISTIILSALISGLILYNLKPSILLSVGGEQQSKQLFVVSDSLIMILKISLLVILVGFWIYRRVKLRKGRKA